MGIPPPIRSLEPPLRLSGSTRVINETDPVAIFAVPNLWQPSRSPCTASKPRRWRRHRRSACTHRKRDATRDNMTHRYRRRYFCRWRGTRSLHTHINTMRRRHYAGVSVSIRSPPPPPSSRSPLVPAPASPMANVIYYFIFFILTRFRRPLTRPSYETFATVVARCLQRDRFVRIVNLHWPKFAQERLLSVSSRAPSHTPILCYQNHTFV